MSSALSHAAHPAPQSLRGPVTDARVLTQVLTLLEYTAYLGCDECFPAGHCSRGANESYASLCLLARDPRLGAALELGLNPFVRALMLAGLRTFRPRPSRAEPGPAALPGLPAPGEPAALASAELVSWLQSLAVMWHDTWFRLYSELGELELTRRLILALTLSAEEALLAASLLEAADAKTLPCGALPADAFDELLAGAVAALAGA